MFKKLQQISIFCILIALISCQNNLCNQNYIWNDGCLKLCSHPDFSNCPNFFTLQYNPRFCAMYKSGIWKSFTHACQACQTSNVIGVKDGRCSCEIEGCNSGERCENGKCQTIPQTSPILPPPCFCPNGQCVYGKCINSNNCINVICQKGFECSAGRCIPTQGYCNSQDDCEMSQFCSENTCTDRCAIMLCRAGHKCIRGQCVPDSTKCKYDYQCPPTHKCNSNGICIDKCSQINCYKGQKCIDGVCVSQCKNIKCQLGYSCMQGKCLPIPGYCNNNLQCKYGQVCIQGGCVNFCSVALCSNGTVCQGTQCIIKQECATHQQCAQGKKCLNHRCVDACIDILCPYNSRCYNGRCIPATGYCRQNNDCPYGSVCRMGNCQNLCALINCSPGYVCINGQCIANRACRNDRQCPVDLSCRNGQCISDCANVLCPINSTCRQGLCYAIPMCDKMQCPEGSVCQQNMCVAVPGYCMDDSTCKPYEFCFNKVCKDKCMYIRCANGFICKQGRCIDICTNVTCSSGFMCAQGICVRNTSMCRSDNNCRSDQFCEQGICKNKCQKVQCPTGSSCFNGVCELALQVCKAEVPFMAKTCRNPRPNNQTCPVIYYVMAPDPKFCGVKSDGSRGSYARECQVCKDPQVQYYFDVPCHQAPFVCEKNQTCLGYYCGQSKCSKSAQCPYDWQTCSNGQCLDICTFLKCHTCMYGQCGYVEAYGNCRVDGDCDRSQWSCVNWKCIDQCKNIRCPPNQRCMRGNCYEE